MFSKIFSCSNKEILQISVLASLVNSSSYLTHLSNGLRLTLMHSKTNITFSIVAIAAAVLLFATGPIVGNYAFASSEQYYHHYYQHHHHHYYHHHHHHHHYYHHHHHYYHHHHHYYDDHHHHYCHHHHHYYHKNYNN
jgi:hypothetical protein